MTIITSMNININHPTQGFTVILWCHEVNTVLVRDRWYVDGGCCSGIISAIKHQNNFNNNEHHGLFTMRMILLVMMVMMIAANNR